MNIDSKVRITLNALRFQLACIQSEIDNLEDDQKRIHKDHRKKSWNRIGVLKLRKIKIAHIILELKTGLKEYHA